MMSFTVTGCQGIAQIYDFHHVTKEEYNNMLQTSEPRIIEKERVRFFPAWICVVYGDSLPYVVFPYTVETEIQQAADDHPESSEDYYAVLRDINRQFAAALFEEEDPSFGGLFAEE